MQSSPSRGAVIKNVNIKKRFKAHLLALTPFFNVFFFLHFSSHNSLFPAHQSQTKYFSQTFRQILPLASSVRKNELRLVSWEQRIMMTTQSGSLKSYFPSLPFFFHLLIFVFSSRDFQLSFLLSSFLAGEQPRKGIFYSFCNPA